MNDTLLENQKIPSQTKSTQLGPCLCDVFRPAELVFGHYLLTRPAFTIIFGGAAKLIINTCRIFRSDICAILRSKRNLQFNTTNTSV